MIQVLLQGSFRVSPQKLFSKYENKDNMELVWTIMKKYFTGNLMYYFIDKYSIVIQLGEKELFVRIGRTEEEESKILLEKILTESFKNKS